LHALYRHAPHADSFVEFGSGWGNLAIPLARAGMNVTAIDIDSGFLARMNSEALALGLCIDSIQSDFMDAARVLNGRQYDCVIFCSSLHHCLDFISLIENIRNYVLRPGGSMFFFAEPVFSNLVFPWGLRYDGESIWAITCNHWLELGFSETFFTDIFSRLGMSLTEIQDETGLCGRSWVARNL
jgi:SAM-dependent methyltransferase